MSSTPSIAALSPWLAAVGALYGVVALAVVVFCRAAARAERLPGIVHPPAAAPLVHRPRTPEALVAEAVRALGADDAALFGSDLDGVALRVVAAAVEDGAATSTPGARLARQACLTGRLCVRPPALVPAADEACLPGAALAVPATVGGLRLGALCVTRTGPRPFTARDRGILLRLGGAAAEQLAAPEVAADRRFSAS
jgi:GAF domain-containing protein